jgi:hypothetical protein
MVNIFLGVDFSACSMLKQLVVEKIIPTVKLYTFIFKLLTSLTFFATFDHSSY